MADKNEYTTPPPTAIPINVEHKITHPIGLVAPAAIVIPQIIPTNTPPNTGSALSVLSTNAAPSSLPILCWFLIAKVTRFFSSLI